MTNTQKQTRQELTQQNFNYFLYNGKHLQESDLLYKLYKADFCKSEAEKAIQFIKNQTIKALKN